MRPRSRAVAHAGQAPAGARPPRRPRAGEVRRALLVAALALPLPLLAGPAAATVCHPARVPAATLLLPYFEVSLEDPNGLTTLFSINNAAAAAVLTHVSIWSDLSVPIMSFDVYLTGYDVQTINLRDVIVNGNLPQTASVGQDPNDTISPRGPDSTDVNYPSCDGKLPPPPLAPAISGHVQDALTGKPSPILSGLCAGQVFGDNVARGYITVDTVNDCTVRFPGDPGYFVANGGGDATDQNVLWGVWFIVNAAQGFAQGAEMVAIEADGTDPATATPGRYTFYGRYDGWTAVDHREPLATTFATQFAGGFGAFVNGTDLLVWRDPKVAQGPVACPVTPTVRPPWYPQGQEGLVIFDEMEHPAVPVTCPFSGSPAPSARPQQCPPEPPFSPFPAATQRTHIGGAAFPVPFDFGWLWLDLNATSAASSGNNPAADPLAQQAWIVFTQSTNGHFAVALDAYRLDSACAANHAVPH